MFKTAFIQIVVDIDKWESFPLLGDHAYLKTTQELEATLLVRSFLVSLIVCALTYTSALVVEEALKVPSNA